MPDRIVRDELLDSARYLELSSDTARLLFVHLLLVADDLGNAEAGDHFVRRRLLGGSISAEAVAKLLSELADADLIRLYTIAGKRYVHVPRFRQRLRYLNGKHPRPPAEIESQEIRDLLEKRPSEVGPKPDRGQSQVGRSEVKRSEEVQNRASNNRRDTSNGEPVDNSGKQVKIAIGNNTITKHLTATANAGESNGNSGQNWNSPAWVNATGATLGLEPRSRESATDYRDRVYTELAKRNRKAR